MLGRKFLSVGRILLICSLAHCHHLSDRDEDYLNRQALRVAKDLEQGSAGQRIPQDRDSDNDQRLYEDRISGAHRGGYDPDILLQEVDRNGIDPKDFRMFVEKLREDVPLGQGKDEGDESEDEDTRSSRLNRAIFRRKRGRGSIDPISNSFDLGEERDDGSPIIDGRRSKRRDRLEEEFKEEKTPSTRRDEERSNEEEEEEKDGRPSKSKPEDQVSRYEGWEEYEGVGIYKFHRRGADSFDEANEICKLEGGHLAIANSKDEADVLVTLWLRHGPEEESDAYVGIHRRNSEKVFRTVLGDTLVSTGYLAWRAGEPDNQNGVEDCVSFYRYGGYRDIPCSGARPFICELGRTGEH